MQVNDSRLPKCGGSFNYCNSMSLTGFTNKSLLLSYLTPKTVANAIQQT